MIFFSVTESVPAAADLPVPVNAAAGPPVPVNFAVTASNVGRSNVAVSVSANAFRLNVAVSANITVTSSNVGRSNVAVSVKVAPSATEEPSVTFGADKLSVMVGADKLSVTALDPVTNAVKIPRAPKPSFSFNFCISTSSEY